MCAQVVPKPFTASPTQQFKWQDHAPGAFDRPIAIIESDHECQLAICNVLDRLLHNPRHGASEQEIVAVREYLRTQLQLHIADEEEDLFPLLRRRAEPDDDLEQILGQLHLEHHADRHINDNLCRDVDCLIGGQAFADPSRFLMNAFAFSETQRRHLAWENAVIVTRARRCLTDADCAELGARMAARRGVKHPA